MTPEIAPPASLAFERDDIELVKLFLSKYKNADGNSYTLEKRPEIVERKEKAVEAIAVDKNAHHLAIEHTLIQPFEGKMSDDIPFLTVFEQLRTDPSLRVPNRFIDVLVPAFSIPKGIEWKDVAQKVREWFLSARNTFPAEGETWHKIPNLSFELKVLVQTMELRETRGTLVVGRLLPPGEPFEKVLLKALTNKVPKLVAAPADKHILLFEDDGTAIGFTKITKGIDDSVDDFPDLKKVDGVWVVHTMAWKSSGDVHFCHVWPGGVKERFWIKDERFAVKTNKKIGLTEKEAYDFLGWPHDAKGNEGDDWLPYRCETPGCNSEGVARGLEHKFDKCGRCGHEMKVVW